jgi:maleylpyruvate isomerase
MIRGPSSSKGASPRGVMRLYAIPFSTNVERVTLALAHKGLACETVLVPADDRLAVRHASGQDLVPVLDDDGHVVADSLRILAHLEARFPRPPLYPADTARRAELEVFLDWFDLVWKVPPNAIDAELGRPEPDGARIAELGALMTERLDRFEAMLAGRPYLMGDELTAADLAAFPFLRFGLLGCRPDDHERFHRILVEHQPIGDRHPRLAEWIRRVDALPRA